jgi:hypothetical protein
MLVNRAELVATGPEHGTRCVLERGDCGFELKARIGQAYDAIAPGKNLRNLLLMLTCGFQYAKSRGVDYRTNPPIGRKNAFLGTMTTSWRTTLAANNSAGNHRFIGNVGVGSRSRNPWPVGRWCSAPIKK